MNGTMFGTGLLAFAVLSGCTAASNSRLTAVTEELYQLNRAYDKALIEGDGETLERLYALEFRYVGFDGAVRTKTEQIEAFTSGRVDVLSGGSDQVAARLYGDAVLTGRFHGQAKVASHEFAVVERYSTVWVREGRTWRLVLEHATAIKE